jgi:perosamine synthetase
LSALPAYESCPTVAPARERNTASYAVSPYGVNLPSALSLTQEQVELVVAELKAIVLGG